MTRARAVPILRALAWSALVLLAGACAPTAVVFLSPNYNAATVKKVALVDFTDYPSMAGSGAFTTGIFENLLLQDYALVAPDQVAAAMQQLGLPPGAAPGPDALRALAATLGVDAFVVGQVTDFTDASDKTVTEDVPIEQDTPIYTPVESVGRHGEVRTTAVFTGTDFSTVDQPEQETESVPAHVGLSVRMVNAQNGEVLWTASDSEDGDHLNDAAQAASAGIQKAFHARLKSLGAGPAT